MRYTTRARRVAILVVLALAAAGAAPAWAQSSRDVPPTSIGYFEPSPCPFDLPANAVEGRDVICGYVPVPERHAAPDGETIRLAVAVIRSTSESPAPDPLVMEAGGPGMPSLVSVPALLKVASLRAARDIVIVEQRGVLYSEPSLMCEESSSLIREVYGQPLDDEELTTLAQDALRTCYERLVRAGVDPSAYNSLENAADFPVVMDALGYDQFNYYGTSYATALGQHIMRDYPERLRSVVLDSVVLLSVDYLTVYPATTERAFRAFFQACASDPVCGERFPDLEQVFFDLVERYNAEPVKMELENPFGGDTLEVLINGDSLVLALYDQLYWTAAIPLLPASIYALAEGDPHFIEQYVQPMRLSTLSLWSGMYDSVMCSEHRGVDGDGLETAGLYPLAATAMQGLPDPRTLCEAWPVDLVPDYAHEPVSGDIPTLLLSGQFDPITPPANADLVAGMLPYSYRYTLPGIGHGALSNSACAMAVTLDFLNDPYQAPDATCLDSMRVAFAADLDVLADITLAPITIEGYGLRAVVPEGWREIEPGSFAAPGNEAFVLLYRMHTWDELTDRFALDHKLRDEMIHNRQWTLFEGEISGWWGTIAITESGDSVYVVSVLGEAEDIPVLEETILLPALEAFAELS